MTLLMKFIQLTIALVLLVYPLQDITVDILKGNIRHLENEDKVNKKKIYRYHFFYVNDRTYFDIPLAAFEPGYLSYCGLNEQG